MVTLVICNLNNGYIATGVMIKLGRKVIIIVMIQSLYFLLLKIDNEDLNQLIYKYFEQKVMSYTVDLVTEDSFYENVTLGITKLLEADARISNVSIERRPPCDRVALSTWEQRHSTPLPDDLRNFYASTDGFQMRWHYNYSAEENLPVGSIHINALSELCLPSSLKEMLEYSLSKAQDNPRPALNTKSKVLELDDCKSIGKVCLVCTEAEWSIWLLGCDGAWWWLANSFTNYFRMALVHLGLPGWQAIFTNTGPIPWAQQLFLLLAPHLLETDPEPVNSCTDVPLNIIDQSVFKMPGRHFNRNISSNRLTTSNN